MSDFPQEIIDAIIDEIPLAPRATLAACSLTATAFVTSSQRRLFWGISISNLGAYERTAVRLAESPHLGAYVRHLALDITELPKDYPQLKAILPLMPGIERLSITGDANAPPWNQLGQNPRLIDLLALPSLKCFALHHLNHVHSSVILRAFSSVEQVSLSHLHILVPEEAQGSEGVAPQRGPWHLRIWGDAYDVVLPFVLHPNRLPYLQRLARLSIAFSPLTDELKDRFMTLITACSGLKHLTLELEAPLELPRLPGLSSLELWLDVDLVKSPAQLATIVSQTAAAAPHLEVLTLALMDRPKQPPRRQHQWVFSVAEWTALDDALMDMRDLREVVFSLRHFIWNEERFAAFVPYIEQKLPRVSDAELLRFTQGLAFGHPMDSFVD
ncbi:hypothetical protein FB451DRAFT_1552871 [Mycena latifolia]|nr:hypothetical protein FB451DRAFT_1552871 [Mycena latifolia]